MKNEQVEKKQQPQNIFNSPQVKQYRIGAKMQSAHYKLSLQLTITKNSNKTQKQWAEDLKSMRGGGRKKQVDHGKK